MIVYFSEFTTYEVPASVSDICREHPVNVIESSHFMYTTTARYNQGSNYYCQNCGKVYRWKTTLNRHVRYECEKEPNIACPYCSFITNRKTTVQKHIIRKPNGTRHIL